jgi:dynactin complex subunit
MSTSSELRVNCKVGITGKASSLGVGIVRFIGETQFQPGNIWVGVELATPGMCNDCIFLFVITITLLFRW